MTATIKEVSFPTNTFIKGLLGYVLAKKALKGVNRKVVLNDPEIKKDIADLADSSAELNKDMDKIEARIQNFLARYDAKNKR